MTNVEYTSQRVNVCRCRDCVYFNDMSDMGKSSFCDLHTDHSDGVEFEEARLFYTNPDGYCAWGDKCDDNIPANVDNVEAILAWKP